MHASKWVFLLIVCLLSSPAYGLEKKEAAQDSSRIHRLSELCQLWGTVKYFHPYLAYKDIDWDEALVKTIPMVNNADSRKDYELAIEHLLSFLNDPNTYIVKTDGQIKIPTISQAQKSQPYLRWTADSIAIIVATDYQQFTDFTKLSAFQKIFAEAAHSETVIFDLRAPENLSDDFAVWWLNYLFMRAFPTLLSADLPLASSRHLMHSGYPPQTGGTSGGYYSAFVTKTGQTLQATGREPTPKQFVFIINKGTETFSNLLAGLQSAGLATVVAEGSGDDLPGAGGFPLELTDSITVMIGTEELVYSDGSLGLMPDVTVPFFPDTSFQSNPALLSALEIARGKEIKRIRRSAISTNAAIKPERTYPEMLYPPREYRLLALFRFWNVINFFYPYKYLLDRPWEEILPEFIPTLEATHDSLEYTLTIAEMVSRIQDTHGFMRSPVLQSYYGTHSPPMEVKWIEGQTVVTNIPDSLKESVEIGDVVLTVDGEDIIKRRDRLAKIISASTPQALSWRIHRIVLSGSQNSQAKLELKKKNGEIVEISLNRSVPFYRVKEKTPVFDVLPEGLGYIDLNRLTVAQIDSALETVKNTSGLILDMRGYPNGTAWSLAPRFATQKTVAARFQRPELHSPDSTWNSILKGIQAVEPSDKWRYGGKVVMLINEEAISQAEHTCLFIEAATDVTFIGMPTNGANGDVTNITLPGAITVNFTGHDVRHGDGRQLQRVGVQPDIKIEPTIEGIRSGRDEVLEGAIDYLRKVTKK